MPQLPKNNKRKAVNHWAGIHNDPNATISRCPSAHTIPGLVAFAKANNTGLVELRKEKSLADTMQRQVSIETERAATIATAFSLSTSTVMTSTTQSELSFHAVIKRKLDMAVALHIVEDGQILGLPQKAAWREK